MPRVWLACEAGHGGPGGRLGAGRVGPGFASGALPLAVPRRFEACQRSRRGSACVGFEAMVGGETSRGVGAQAAATKAGLARREDVGAGLAAARDVAGQHPGLRRLVLYGSCARGEAHAGSDWDFGFLGDGVDTGSLAADLVGVLGSERVDLVDLGRIGALLAFHVARDGVVLHASPADAFVAFQLRATHHWLEMADTARAAHAELLAALGTHLTLPEALHAPLPG